MRKTLYLILTFLICYILGLTEIWTGFCAMLLILNLFRFEEAFVWEIPLAVLGCGVLRDAFINELDNIIKILLPCAAVLISYRGARRLWLFFPIAVWTVFQGGEYAFSIMSAAVWYGMTNLVTANGEGERKPSVKKVF